MRRVALSLFSTVTGLVMLLSFKTHSNGAAGVPVATGAVEPGIGDAAAGEPASASSGGTGSTRTITGDLVDTKKGPVQVQITVRNRTMTAVTAITYPLRNQHEVQLNGHAVPQLNSEALAAGSAKIDAVSGATYTSQGYIASLQSALDKAGL